MNRLFQILFFSLAFCTAGMAQTGVFNPKELNNGNKGIVYDKEAAADLKLFSNGWSLGVNIGKLKTYYRTHYYHFGIGELKHNREFKNRDGITGTGRSARSYSFGKQNNLYTLRAGYGIKRYYSEKARKKGLAIGASYQGGFTLGLLKPYYLEIRSDEPGIAPVVRNERFTGDNAASFLTPERINGAAPAITGLSEIQLRPGFHFNGGLHFDWGAFDEFVKAIEVGIAADIFFGDIPLLVDEASFTSSTGVVTEVLPENVNNRPFFINLYVSFQFGKRW